jgi:hypothetical protein
MSDLDDLGTFRLKVSRLELTYWTSCLDYPKNFLQPVIDCSAASVRDCCWPSSGSFESGKTLTQLMHGFDAVNLSCTGNALLAISGSVAHVTSSTGNC